MVAAAGCGKTHVIATAVGKHGGGRDLVLTHTHAGVEAIRRRLVELGPRAEKSRVDTIAGWALRLAMAFPRIADLPTAQPRTSAEYRAVYAAATRLLGIAPTREILRASYSGVYVDEYQDCTREQHELVLALRDTLPCRVVGDPLQGIFDFGDNDPIRWEEHVARSFEAVPGPTKPWRWANSNPALGEWLLEVRNTLLDGGEVPLDGAPVEWIDGGGDPTSAQGRQRSACFELARKDGETVIAIHHLPNQCHFVASRLRGLYSCVEAIDTDDLYDSARRIEESEALARAVAVIDFAAKCATRVRTELRTIRGALAEERVPKVRKHKSILRALLAVAEDASPARVEPALRDMSELPGAHTYRRELLREMIRAVRAVLCGDTDSLADAAWVVRNRTRRRGRHLPRCAVGTTLLVKGLEFDHAVVLDADGYDARNLYVALTRSSGSLTVVSRSRTIRPV